MVSGGLLDEVDRQYLDDHAYEWSHEIYNWTLQQFLEWLGKTVRLDEVECRTLMEVLEKAQRVRFIIRTIEDDNWPSKSTASGAYKKRPISPGLRRAVFQRDGFRCCHCGSQNQLRADHIISESNGGPTVLENLETLCNSCNSRKGRRNGQRHLPLWLPEMGTDA